MNIESFREYCLKKPGVTEEFPFGEDVLVFKVMGKMFALTNLESFESVSLKVVPEEGAELRDSYPAVQEAYHMNKTHWVTVIMDGTIADQLLKQWVDKSYTLVVAGLTKSQRSALGAL